LPKMRGTGADPLGRYSEGLIFDLEDNDPRMIQDFVDRGWATLLDEKDHPGRSVTQIANAMVRGDALTDPAEQEIAKEIGDNAHAIVHLEDPDATEKDYEEEAAKGPGGEQVEYHSPIAADSLGGIVGGGREKGGGESGGSKSRSRASSSSGTATAEEGS